VTGPGFVHLHVHSSYSLLEGAITIGRLAELAKADRQPALALTDTDNMFGALEFSEKMVGCGIQPIVGCTLAIDFADLEGRARHQALRPLPRIVLLAASEQGYLGLMRLISRSHLDSAVSEAPHLPLTGLVDETAGLIALTGGPFGPLDQAIAAAQPDLAQTRAEALVKLFGDRLYVELQRHGLEAERQIGAALVDIAYRRGIPLVAANEPFFATREDYEAHDALLSIAEGRLIADSSRRQLTAEHHFKSRSTMAALFPDLPEALASSVEIAQRCAFRPLVRKPILPRFSVSTEPVDEASELSRRARAGLEARLERHGLARGHSVHEYWDRLEFELGVIGKMRFPGYFLIVADFIQWAKAKGIPVGPGRGSGAGSLVAYALTITDLDPIRFGLLFERFLNPERISMPDFDVDFCQDRRDEVIGYVRERYGANRVAQIITFGTLQARGVLRDVGRVLAMPYGQVDKLCKLVPQNPANPIPLARAIAEEPRLQAARDSDPLVKRAFDIAEKLEGLHRHASTHAAGIVIADRALTELVPLYRDPKSSLPVTQFNMKWVEQAGLVKFDFLGLKTLTVLANAAKLVRGRGIEIDLSNIPLDDAKTYEALCRGETVGVFQVESQGMRRALVDMRPDRFEDLIALVALYRPGPMANIPSYCARKLGREKVEYLHPKLVPILEATYGIITYQEQVMQIARDLAGYSFGEADLLRRAMGKKIRSEMEKQRERFISGAVERGIHRSDAQAIFEACAKFADYGFNKSHSAPYALLTYQTAYMKANYPVEFLAASMSCEMGNIEKLAEFRAEAARLGIRVEAPSVNRSDVAFEVEAGNIRYALAALKGVGAHAIEAIVAARSGRPFRDLSDFAGRINPRAINRRVIESLAAAGAFDELEPNRGRVHAGADCILAEAQRRYEAALKGQSELFAAAQEAHSLALPAAEPWHSAERLQREYEATGFFLSGHPLNDYAEALARLRAQPWAAFSRAVKAGATAGRLSGTVVSRTERRAKTTGNRMAIVGLSDPSGQYEAVIFAEGLQQYRDMLEPGNAVLLLVAAEVQGEDVRVRIQSVELLDRAAERMQKGMRVFLRSQTPLEGVIRRLQPKGDGEVSLILILEDGATEVEIRLPGTFKVSPQVCGAIKAVPGVVEVQAL
jgi:DNA polymerase III subunit alpha